MITDKLVAKIPASYSGKVIKLNLKNDEICQVGQPLLEMEVSDDVKVKEEAHEESEPAPAEAPKPAEKAPEAAPAAADDSKVYTTQAVRVLADSLKVDLTKVTGTGRKGRVTKEDVLKFVETGGKSSCPFAAAKEKHHAKSMGKQEVPVPGKFDKVIKLAGLRKVQADIMADALVVPHYNLQDLFALDSVRKAQRRFKEMYPKGELAIMPFLMKAVSCALREFPMFNGYTPLAKAGQDFINDYVEKAEHNFGIVMDTPEGVVIPNIKSVQNKPIAQINDELNLLMERTKKSALTKEDLSNGTMNFSEMGCTKALPLLYRPQICMFGIGLTRYIPEVKMVAGAPKVLPVEIMSASMSCDHRIVDGAMGGHFMSTVKRYLENTDLLILNLK